MRIRLLISYLILGVCAQGQESRDLATSFSRMLEKAATAGSPCLVQIWDQPKKSEAWPRRISKVYVDVKNLEVLYLTYQITEGYDKLRYDADLSARKPYISYYIKAGHFYRMSAKDNTYISTQAIDASLLLDVFFSKLTIKADPFYVGYTKVAEKRLAAALDSKIQDDIVQSMDFMRSLDIKSKSLDGILKFGQGTTYTYKLDNKGVIKSFDAYRKDEFVEGIYNTYVDELPIKLRPAVLIEATPSQPDTKMTSVTEQFALQAKPEQLITGIVFKNLEQSTVIISILPGSPAEVSGLKKGDEILQVNGKDVAGLTEEAIRDIISQATFVRFIVKKESNDIKKIELERKRLDLVPIPK